MKIWKLLLHQLGKKCWFKKKKLTFHLRLWYLEESKNKWFCDTFKKLNLTQNFIETFSETYPKCDLIVTVCWHIIYWDLSNLKKKSYLSKRKFDPVHMLIEFFICWMLLAYWFLTSYILIVKLQRYLNFTDTVLLSLHSIISSILFCRRARNAFARKAGRFYIFSGFS